ncbi:hypothetical protein AAMO2058_000697600 [Amorphochlora amoebiformis]
MISDAYGAVRRLLDVIGFNLLFLNIGVQGILLGTVREWSANARKYWFAQHGHLTASEMTLLLAIATSPWAFQGILSLSLPECYTWGRKGYLISLLVALLVAYSVLGSREPQKFSPRVVVLCFFIETLCFVVNWLILDGRISRSIRRFPAQGHALTFFFWFFRRGGTLVGLIASGLSLKLIHSARWSFPLMLIPVTITLGIVISNFVPKTSLRLNSDFELLPTDFDPDDQNNPPSPALPDDEEGAPIRKGLVAPALQCACLATIITILPLLGVSPYVAFLAGVFAGLWVGLAVRNVLGPKLGRINIYYMLARGFNLSISTAVLLCLRDNSHSKTSQDAQKVSPLIYTTTLGVITQVCGILGIVLYAMFMRRWTWRTIFRVPAVLGIVLNACISVILVRRNNRLELSDTWFILGLEAIVSIVDDMNAIPKYHLLPNYCPDGAETAIFAIFASCYHLMVGWVTCHHPALALAPALAHALALGLGLALRLRLELGLGWAWISASA